MFPEVTAISLTPSLDIKEQTLPGALLGIRHSVCLGVLGGYEHTFACSAKTYAPERE